MNLRGFSFSVLLLSSRPVNRAGELVGLIFDGNIQSLVLSYSYTNKEARAFSVDSRAILEALAKVYKADGLVAELVNGKSRD